MTYREERMLYSCITIMMLILAIGIVVGFYIREIKEADYKIQKDEIYFQEKAMELYNLAMDIQEEKNSEKKKNLLGLLNLKCYGYNSEAEKINDWTYRCPRRFTTEYLLNKKLKEEDK